MKNILECHQGKAQQDLRPNFYDQVYATSEEYQKNYHESYYKNIYLKTLDILVQKRTRNILEVGCGCGTFAEMLASSRYSCQYTGFDFSEVAIARAKNRAQSPHFTFQIDNIYTSSLFKSITYDAVVCHEVLEHILKDMDIFAKIPSGTLFIGSVPSFDSKSHVRYFSSEDQVRYRYGAVCNIEEIFFMDLIYIFYGTIN